MTWQDKIAYHKQRSDEIAQDLILKIEQGVDRWEMPWHKGLPLARNRVTGKYYNGKNHLILWDECLKNEYSHNIWATLRQWNRVNSGIKKGSKGTLIKFAIPNEELKNYDQIEIEFEDNQSEDLNGYKIFFNYVFNVDQVTNNNEGQIGIFDDIRPEEEIIDDFVTRTGANIVHHGDRAFYQAIKDKITMPPIAAFKTTGEATAKEHYYSTLLHELVHWTGHISRCDRSLINTFGSAPYAFEELVAELGTAILTTQFKKRLVPRHGHAKYLNSWLTVLKSDFKFFIEALELAKTANIWLYEKTQILPHPINGFYPKSISDELFSELKEEFSVDESDQRLSKIIKDWYKLSNDSQKKVLKLIKSEIRKNFVWE